MGLTDANADRCIYPRPFPEGFDDCPAFQATSFIAADSRNKPLGTWRTCRHLGTGKDLESRGRFYPRCALGDQRQRLQWLANQLRDLVQVRSFETGTSVRLHMHRDGTR